MSTFTFESVHFTVNISALVTKFDCRTCNGVFLHNVYCLLADIGGISTLIWMSVVWLVVKDVTLLNTY